MSTKDPAYVADHVGVVLDAFMTDTPIDLEAARNATITEAMGALVVFEGIVRDHDGGQRVTSLTYTSHPSADGEIKRVAKHISEAHPLTRLWTAHRTGALAIGDTAFVVMAAAAHRQAAFTAASELADAVKAEVPIWKEQTLTDGSVTWVGLE